MKSWWILLLVIASPCIGFAQDDFDRDPIRYTQSKPDNIVSRLEDRLAKGDASLKFEEPWGYLRSVLTELKVPETSQTLVFSKTSLQRHKISPRTPRAIFFNDDAYVGYCRNGEVLEISVADAQLGTVYYTLKQEPDESPEFRRQTDNCLICHAGGQARGVPGHLVRSMYVDKSGHPLLASGSFRIDHTSPLSDRYGGWYVSGQHGNQKHLGNLTYQGRPDNDAEHDPSGLNLTDLSAKFDRGAYLNGHSDLVALMILAHQAGGHNLLTKTAFDVRSALHREDALNRELKEAPDHRWDSTNTILKNAADSLVKYFLFVNETALTEPISGSTDYAKDFAAAGPRDSLGRSLRDFDLQTRMFKHPCSYLIETESFYELPPELRTRFWKRLDEVLRGSDEKEFAHLTAADRQAIRAILLETHRDVPKEWATVTAAK
ncbi:MAG TPA: hypothetical protein VFG20_13095 [Planctomycetaceae bacterium]|nr:hypothetical protein [Planctomycetaceae bacterium]